jgi:hypothetical protein
MTLSRASLAGTLPGRSLKTGQMPWFANGQTLIGADTTAFTSTTTPATPNTKSGWVQIIASSSADCGLLVASFVGTQAATDRSIMLDIAIGAAGAETPIVQNIACGGMPFSFPITLPLPVFIPQGSRISWRAQTALASQSPSGVLQFVTYRTGDNTYTPRSLDTLGAVTATSRGTAMSGSAGTYTEITAATSQPYQALIVFPSTGNTSGLPTVNSFLTLGIGASGSEVAIGSSQIRTQGGAILADPNFNQPSLIIGRQIPAGTRIAVAHNLASNPGNLQVVVIGVPYR